MLTPTRMSTGVCTPQEFSQEQAQLVYDLACDRLMPMIAELASMFEADSQMERSTQHFGGEERWQEIARQIDAWGHSRLPSRVFEALCTTFEGVVAMPGVISGDKPVVARRTGFDGSPTEADLKQMIRDRATGDSRTPRSSNRSTARLSAISWMN